MNAKKILSHLQEPFIKNAIYLLTTIFTINAFGFVFWIMATRFFSAEEVGLSSTIISLITLISTFAMLGLNIALIRFLSNSNTKNNLINSCFTLIFVSALILSVILAIGTSIWVPTLTFFGSHLMFAVIFVVLTVISSITIMLNSIFIANRTSQFVFIKETIFSVSRIPVLVFFISFGTFGIIASWGIGLILAFIFGLAYLFKTVTYYKPKIKVDRAILKDMLNFSFWNYIASLFKIAPALILPIIITNILSPDKTAYFFISWTIAALLFSIPQQTSQSLLAQGSGLDSDNTINVIKSIKFILLFLIPSIIFVFIFGEKILSLFGKEYSTEGFLLLQIFSISTIPLSVNIIYLTIKNLKKESKIVALINGITAFITLFGSYIFMRDIGIISIGLSWTLGNLITIPIIIYYEKIHLK